MTFSLDKLKNVFTFEGVLNRKNFWLLTAIIMTCYFFLNYLLGFSILFYRIYGFTLLKLGVFIAMLPLIVKRLRDTGKNAVWILPGILAFIGWAVLPFFYFSVWNSVITFLGVVIMIHLCVQDSVTIKGVKENTQKHVQKPENIVIAVCKKCNGELSSPSAHCVSCNVPIYEPGLVVSAVLRILLFPVYLSVSLLAFATIGLLVMVITFGNMTLLTDPFWALKYLPRSSANINLALKMSDNSIHVFHQGPYKDSFYQEIAGAQLSKSGFISQLSSRYTGETITKFKNALGNLNI